MKVKLGLALALGMVFAGSQPAFGGDYYAGALGGIATLSADGRSVLSPAMSQLSLYKPENGPALNVLAGWDFSRYLSVQGNYIWNRNDLTLVSTAFGSAATSQYEEARSSQQSSVIVDLLGYMRARDSRVRPYLSCGTGLEHLSSSVNLVKLATGSLPLPPQQFSANHIALRVAVGIDLKIARGWAFRYSFSEAIASNPISQQLVPPGQRGLENFQNLFGLVWHF
ncbi:MAG TPA: outer membrane beta-barrel protein [Terriglobia bacterium]|nr:outer membrane beta-barrel protein [Terriglobia bacterium]